MRVRATREALAAGLLRASELDDAYDALELLDSELPAAEDRSPVGVVTGRVQLREEILRVLAAGEDAGRSALTLVRAGLAADRRSLAVSGAVRQAIARTVTAGC
jgi:hypothetical protein